MDIPASNEMPAASKESSVQTSSSSHSMASPRNCVTMTSDAVVVTSVALKRPTLVGVQVTTRFAWPSGRRTRASGTSTWTLESLGTTDRTWTLP